MGTLVGLSAHCNPLSYLPYFAATLKNKYRGEWMLVGLAAHC